MADSVPVPDLEPELEAKMLVAVGDDRSHTTSVIRLCARVAAEAVAERDAHLAELQRRLYEGEAASGWTPDNSFAEECAHLHEEVSEAFRAWRLRKDAEVWFDDDGKPQGVPIELADVLIGLFYNAEVLGFDLLEAVEIKHAFNVNRDYQAEGRQLHSSALGTPEEKT